MTEFDFDDWAQLYQNSPDIFEARRRTMLALTIAAYPSAQPMTSACLRRVESECADLPPLERSVIAFRAMAGSLEELRFRFTELDQAMDGLKTSLATAQEVSAR